MNLRELRSEIDQRKGEKRFLVDEVGALAAKTKETKRSLRRHEQAAEIIRQVGLETQRQLQVHIGDVVSLALDTVYDEPYEFGVEFVMRRNKTECDLFFQRNSERVDPLSAAGGGVVNVAAFALRVACWSMQRPRSLPVLVLDEPFANLSADLMPRASEMVRQVAERLDVQVLMVTHAEGLVEAADKVFRVTMKKGISKVKEE